MRIYFNNVWFQKILIPLPHREFQIRPLPHLSGFPIFSKDKRPPPLQNFQKHLANSPAPLETFILKRNCANVLNIRLLAFSHKHDYCVVPIDRNISENDTYCFRHLLNSKQTKYLADSFVKLPLYITIHSLSFQSC